jgi:hypothetical protein
MKLPKSFWGEFSIELVNIKIYTAHNVKVLLIIFLSVTPDTKEIFSGLDQRRP